MKKNRILVTLSTFCEFDVRPRELLEESKFEFVENKSGKRMDPKEILSWGTDWTGLIAGVEPYTAETLRQLGSLKCISRVGTGIDAIDRQFASQNNITIRNTPDAPTSAVAEMTVAHILDLMKLLSYHNSLMKEKKWLKKTGFLLSGKTVGIVGTGRIGKKVAELLKGFGVRLLGFDVVPDNSWAAQTGCDYCTMETVLRESDIVTLHAAVPKNERFLIGREELLKMKNGSFLVNIARGNLMDEQAVLEALKNGKLKGAAMDVYPYEPYTGAYCDQPNVLLTPHIATLTRETRTQMETEAVSNLLEELRKLD